MAAVNFTLDDTERRIIADALARHATALESFHTDAAAANGDGAANLLVEAQTARALHARFVAVA